MWAFFVFLFKIVVTTFAIIFFLLFVYHYKNSRKKSKSNDHRSNQENSAENNAAAAGSSAPKKTVRHPYRRAKSVTKTTEADEASKATEAAEKVKSAKQHNLSQKSKSKEGKNKKVNNPAPNVVVPAVNHSASDVHYDILNDQKINEVPVRTKQDIGVPNDVKLKQAKDVNGKNSKRLVVDDKESVKKTETNPSPPKFSDAETSQNESSSTILEVKIKPEAEKRVPSNSNGTESKAKPKSASDHDKKANKGVAEQLDNNSNNTRSIPDKIAGPGNVTSGDRSSLAVPDAQYASNKRVCKSDLNVPELSGVSKITSEPSVQKKNKNKKNRLVDDSTVDDSTDRNKVNTAESEVRVNQTSAKISKGTKPIATVNASAVEGKNEAEIVIEQNEPEIVIEGRHASGDSVSSMTEDVNDISMEKFQKINKRKNRTKALEPKTHAQNACSSSNDTDCSSKETQKSNASVSSGIEGANVTECDRVVETENVSKVLPGHSGETFQDCLSHQLQADSSDQEVSTISSSPSSPTLALKLEAVNKELEQKRQKVNDLEVELATNQINHTRIVSDLMAQLNNCREELEAQRSRSYLELQTMRAQKNDAVNQVLRLKGDNERMQELEHRATVSETTNAELSRTASSLESSNAELKRTIKVMDDALRQRAVGQNKTFESTVQKLKTELKSQEMREKDIEEELDRVRKFNAMEHERLMHEIVLRQRAEECARLAELKIVELMNELQGVYIIRQQMEQEQVLIHSVINQSQPTISQTMAIGETSPISSNVVSDVRITPQFCSTVELNDAIPSSQLTVDENDSASHQTTTFVETCIQPLESANDMNQISPSSLGIDEEEIAHFSSAVLNEGAAHNSFVETFAVHATTDVLEVGLKPTLSSVVKVDTTPSTSTVVGGESTSSPSAVLQYEITPVARASLGEEIIDIQPPAVAVLGAEIPPSSSAIHIEEITEFSPPASAVSREEIIPPAVAVLGDEITPLAAVVLEEITSSAPSAGLGEEMTSLLPVSEKDNTSTGSCINEDQSLFQRELNQSPAYQAVAPVSLNLETNVGKHFTTSPPVRSNPDLALTTNGVNDPALCSLLASTSVAEMYEKVSVESVLSPSRLDTDTCVTSIHTPSLSTNGILSSACVLDQSCSLNDESNDIGHSSFVSDTDMSNKVVESDRENTFCETTHRDVANCATSCIPIVGEESEILTSSCRLNANTSLGFEHGTHVEGTVDLDSGSGVRQIGNNKDELSIDVPPTRDYHLTNGV